MSDEEIKEAINACVKEIKEMKPRQSGVSIGSVITQVKNLSHGRAVYGAGYAKDNVKYYTAYGNSFVALGKAIADIPNGLFNNDRIKKIADEIYVENFLGELRRETMINKNDRNGFFSCNLEIRDSERSTTLAKFGFASYGPFVTVSFYQYGFPTLNLIETERGREIYTREIKECIEKIIQLAGNKLVLFSDATSARTFSLLKDILGKDYFLYLVTGIKNPNTGNLMDVATTRESLESFSKSIDSNKLEAAKMLKNVGVTNMFNGFTGLCGGEVAIATNMSSTAKSFADKKRGVFPVFHTEDIEPTDKNYVPIFEGTKNAFIYTKKY